MKNKNIILLFSLLLIIIFLIGFFSIKFAKNKKANENQNEYVPQEEISNEQLRETIVSLYFPDKETNMLKPEARLVNVKELIQSPFNVLVGLLVEGPKNEKLSKIIPDNTKLLNSSLEGECLTLDFSEEILNYDKQNEKSKDNLINSIVNTVTELNEVNKVKFLVNGQTNDEFKDEFVRK